MSNIHIISDLFLGFNEQVEKEEIIPESADLIVFNGNLGHTKRGMLYVETLCKKYPDVQFVYNPGQTEKYQTFMKTKNEFENTLTIRKNSSQTWPKNLHWSLTNQIIKLRNDKFVDVMCAYGFPKIHKCNIEWKDTIWYKDYAMEILDEGIPNYGDYKPKETSNVKHGQVPVFATMDYINDQHTHEWSMVKTWELQKTCYKILVTHVNPFNDERFYGLETSPYLIHLHDGLWIGSNKFCDGVNFLGSRLYSNPGRGEEARSRIVSINN